MDHFFTIIGGMGTKASETYIEFLNSKTPANKDQDYLNYILVNHATIPDRTSYILNHNEPNPLPVLLKDIKLQSKLLPDFFVITCNTAHYFYDELQINTDVPILHMPREAVNFIKEKHPGIKKVGLIATSGTLNNGIYDQAITNAGYQLIKPTKQIELETMQLIYDDIKNNNFVDHNLYRQILEEMHALGSEVIILGCTELSIAQNQSEYNELPVIDAMDILVNKSLELALKYQNKNLSF